jgi:hypothetical protein
MNNNAVVDLFYPAIEFLVAAFRIRSDFSIWIRLWRQFRIRIGIIGVKPYFCLSLEEVSIHSKRFKT